MLISDPPLVFDLKQIGEKVQFSQFKHDSLDGFIKGNEECLVVLPPVHKFLGPSAGGAAATVGEMVIKAQVLPINYEFP